LRAVERAPVSREIRMSASKSRRTGCPPAAAEPGARRAEPAIPPNCVELQASARGIGAVADSEDADARPAASFAAVCGSSPRLFEPSVRTTIHVHWRSRHDGRGGVAPSALPTGRPVRWRRASQNALADGGAERGRETTERTEQLLRVRAGGTRTTAVLAKATRPMRGPPVWDLTKALVACSAA